MTRDQIDTLSRVFNKAYEGVDANGFYDDAAPRLRRRSKR